MATKQDTSIARTEAEQAKWELVFSEALKHLSGNGYGAAGREMLSADIARVKDSLLHEAVRRRTVESEVYVEALIETLKEYCPRDTYAGSILATLKDAVSDLGCEIAEVCMEIVPSLARLMPADDVESAVGQIIGQEFLLPSV